MKIKPLHTFKTFLLFFVIISFLVLTLVLINSYSTYQTSLTHYRFRYNQHRVIQAPHPNTPFEQYVATTKQKIRKALQPLFLTNHAFIGGFDIDQVVAFRAPENISPPHNSTLCQNNKTKKGFLFLHALTDTPYSGKTLRKDLQKYFPCANYRSVLMPGHGTLPGDSLHTDYRQWIATTKYGIVSFPKEVTAVFIVSYSTGFTLAINHLQGPTSMVNKVKGVIGLSPALKAQDPLIHLVPWIPEKLFPFINAYPDTNPMKYESFSLNLARQFYNLTKSIADDTRQKGIATPLFMALTSDDATANPVINRDFFCRSVEHRRKQKKPSVNKLFWYQGYKNSTKHFKTHDCKKNIVIRSSSYPKYQHKNLSHSSIVFPPEQPFYGYLMPHHDCRTYYPSLKAFKNCQNYSNSIVYGENNLLKLEEFKKQKNTYYQRSTFNPDYSYLLTEIVSFIKKVDLN